MDNQRLWRVFDWLVLAVFLAGSIYYFPRLLRFAGRQDPEYVWLFVCVGLIPFIGSFGILVPCLTFFNPPLMRYKRVLLGILSLLPLLFALPGILLGPIDLRFTFLRLGVICSLGIWIFALPGAIFNRPLSRIIYQFVGVLIPPRAVRRTAGKQTPPPRSSAS